MRLVTVVSMSLSTVAFAASDAVVAVGQCSDGALGSYVRELRTNLAARPRASVMSEAETIGALGGASASSPADVQRLIASARYDLYEKSAAERAERALLTALEDLSALPPSEDRWKDVRDVRTLLAHVQHKADKKADAESRLERIFRVEPDYQPDRNTFPPSFRSFADQVRAKVKKRGLASLQVQTKPAGLPVYVDARPMGVSPVTVKLPPGDYRIEVGSPTHRWMPREVRLEPAGASIELDRAFEGAVHASKGPCLETEPNREARLTSMMRLAGFLRVPRLIAGRFEEGPTGDRYLVVSVLDTMSGQETQEAKVKLGPAGPPLGGIARLADFVATGEALSPVVPVKGAVMPETERVEVADGAVKSAPDAAVAVTAPARRPPIGTYVAGGVSAAALLASGYFFLQASNADGQLKTHCGGELCQGDTAETARLTAAIDRNNTMGAIALGVGAASAAVAGALLLWSGGEEARAIRLRPSPGGVAVEF